MNAKQRRKARRNVKTIYIEQLNKEEFQFVVERYKLGFLTYEQLLEEVRKIEYKEVE